MFIDSSVMVAMMSDEDAARHFAGLIKTSTTRVTSPMAAASAVIDVASALRLPMADAGDAVKAFLDILQIQLLAVPPRAAFMAADAFGRYGKGLHAANLDFGDCMTYACARYYRQALLTQAGGFAETDIELA